MDEEIAASPHPTYREENIHRAGMSPEEARYSALRAFGGHEPVKEQCRESRSLLSADQLAKDFRFSIRSLRRSPGFTATILVTLVLGIGIASAIFCMSGDAVLLPLPYPDAGHLYVIGVNSTLSARNLSRPARYFPLYQDKSNLFAEFAAVGRDFCNVVVDGDPRATTVIRRVHAFF